MMNKNLKWIMVPFWIIILICLMKNDSTAATYQSLEEAKNAVWSGVISTENNGDPDVLEEDLIIDGAVSSTGEVKTIVGNWDKKAIPKEQEVKVYSEPGGTQVAGKIFEDTIASVISEDGEWLEIYSGFLHGYVKKDDIRSGELAEKRANNVCPIQVMSNECDTKVMSEPSKSGSVLNYMTQRRGYPIVEELEGWYLIQISEGVKGYVNAEEIDKFRITHIGRRMQDMKDPQKPFLKETLTGEERKLLAAIIYCESAGESFEGQAAVGVVVMNRVKSDAYPDTVKEVIYQDGQFEPVSNKKLDYILSNDSSISASCYEAADAVIQGENGIGDALFFKINGSGTQIGNHGFY